MIDHRSPAVFRFLYYPSPATSLPQHPLGLLIHCLCKDLMSLCIQMFLICLAALYIIRSPQISNLSLCGNSFVYCFQFLRHLHRLRREILIISLLPYFFSEIDRRNLQNICLRRKSLNLIQQTLNLSSDHFCRRTKDRFAVIGSQHKHHQIDRVMCLQ